MSNAIVSSDNNAIVNNSEFDIPTGYICTVDRSTREGAITVANALSDADSLTTLGDESFVLVDVITTPGVRSQTGEACVNTYLVANDGHIYMTQSDGIARSANYIVGLFSVNGVTDFGDGITVNVTTKQLASGRTMKSLRFTA